MGEFWKDADEVVKAVTGMMGKVSKDEELVTKYGKANKLILYTYTDPDVQLWLDARGKFEYGAGDPPGKPDLHLTLSADDGHRAWAEKLNVVMAISRKKFKVEGSITTMMSLAPLQKRFTAAYLETLKEMGREDLL